MIGDYFPLAYIARNEVPNLLVSNSQSYHHQKEMTSTTCFVYVYCRLPFVLLLKKPTSMQHWSNVLFLLLETIITTIGQQTAVASRITQNATFEILTKITQLIQPDVYQQSKRSALSSITAG